jgi:hypothetical protein
VPANRTRALVQDKLTTTVDELLQALSVNLAAGSEAIRVARITRCQIFSLDDQSRPLSR